MNEKEDENKTIYYSRWRHGIVYFAELKVTETPKTFRVVSVKNVVSEQYMGYVIRKSDKNIYTNREEALNTLIKDGYKIAKKLVQRRVEVLEDITKLEQLAGRSNPGKEAKDVR